MCRRDQNGSFSMEIGDKYVDLRAYSFKFRKTTPISVGKVATESDFTPVN